MVDSVATILCCGCCLFMHRCRLGSGSGGAKTAEDISFEEINAYITDMEPLLTGVVRHTQQLIKRRRGAPVCGHGCSVPVGFFLAVV